MFWTVLPPPFFFFPGSCSASWACPARSYNEYWGFFLSGSLYLYLYLSLSFSLYLSLFFVFVLVFIFVWYFLLSPWIQLEAFDWEHFSWRQRRSRWGGPCSLSLSFLYQSLSLFAMFFWSPWKQLVEWHWEHFSWHRRRSRWGGPCSSQASWSGCSWQCQHSGQLQSGRPCLALLQ